MARPSDHNAVESHRKDNKAVVWHSDVSWPCLGAHGPSSRASYNRYYSEGMFDVFIPTLIEDVRLSQNFNKSGDLQSVNAAIHNGIAEKVRPKFESRPGLCFNKVKIKGALWDAKRCSFALLFNNHSILNNRLTGSSAVKVLNFDLTQQNSFDLSVFS